MDILRYAHGIFEFDAIERRERAAGADLAMITDKDARLSLKVLSDKAAGCRPMNLRPAADPDSFGMGKSLPRRNLASFAARIEHAHVLWLCACKIGMICSQKPFPLAFIGIEGDFLHLIGAPNFRRQGDDHPAAGNLHRTAVCQHSIILPFVIAFIPRKIPLRREKRRQQATDVHNIARSISETHLGDVSFRRQIDDTALIRRIHEIAAHGQRLAANDAEHTDALILKDCQHLLDRLLADKAYIVIDIDLILGICHSQNFVDLRRIRPCRIDRKVFDRISCRPSGILQRKHAEVIPCLIRLPHQDSDLSFI